MPRSLEEMRAIGPFAGWLQRSIVHLKYHGEWARAHHLGEVLAEAISGTDLRACDAVVPVPLHPRRLQARGYNQTELLARRAAALSGLPLQPVLRRVRDTDRQVGSTIAQRHANVANAFRADARACEGRRLLIVDDVLTTGATLASCAEAVQAAGAISVSVLTLARQMPAPSSRAVPDR